MAKTPIKSSLSYIKYSTVDQADIATNGKTIVCLRNLEWNATADIADEDTFCGSFRSVGSAVHELSGEGLSVGDYAATEASAMDLMNLMHAGTLIYFEAANVASSPVTAGETMHLAADGYFSDVTITNDHPGMSTFSFTIAVNGGNADLTPA